MKLFIDADSILFKAACTGKDKGTEDNYLDNVHDVKLRVNKVVEDTISDCFASDVYIAIKGKNNFRYNIFADYKANRADKPMGDNLRKRLNEAYYHMEKKYNAVAADNMEADDLVSIWAHEARENEEDWVIAHIDKDINQIAGTHYNYNTKEIYHVSDDMADMYFCRQLLTGDGGDNIPKLYRGLGPKTAEKYLDGTSYDDRINIIVDLYRHHYGTGWQDRLNVIGNLLWMKRTFSNELEWNYKDRYNGKTHDSESNECEKSSKE